MRVLALGTFPIIHPIFGGQRRAHAMRLVYEKHGIPYRWISVYDPASNIKPGPYDLPLGSVSPGYKQVEFMTDVLAGIFACDNENAFSILSKNIVDFRPTHIQLEQPYLLPFVEKLLNIPQFASLRIIYSSHNVEAPLKQVMLGQTSVNAGLANNVISMIEQWERAAVTRARLVIAVSAEDADEYTGWNAHEVIVCRNGVSEFPVDPAAQEFITQQFEGRPFLLVVGGSHQPNIDGFIQLIAERNTPFVKPYPAILVCGAMAIGIMAHRDFRRLVRIGQCTVATLPGLPDSALGAIKQACHGFLLPITWGGGSNLKTAEALVSGKYVIGTHYAFRSFEKFLSGTGVTIADTPAAFKAAMSRILQQPPLGLSPEEKATRQELYWEHTLQAFATRIQSGDI